MNDFERKIQLVGNRSYAVSLPKEWILNNNLDQTRVINISERNNMLIVSPKKSLIQLDKKEIIVEDTETIPSMIILSYTRGINELVLKFKNKEEYLESKPIILHILSHIDGYKITNESNNEISITNSYKISESTVQDLSKRMCITINNMVESILQSKTETKIILERDLDNIYHLSKRVLYICSTNFDVMKKNKIQDIEEIFLWRLIFKKIENVGDLIEQLSKRNIPTKDIEEILTHLNNTFILNKKVKYKTVLDLKNKTYSNTNSEKMKELVLGVLNNYFLIELNRSLFTL